MATATLSNPYIQIEVIRRALLECGVTLQELREQLRGAVTLNGRMATEEAIAYYERKHEEIIAQCEELEAELEANDAPPTRAEAMIVTAVDDCDERGLVTLTPAAADRLWTAFEEVGGRSNFVATAPYRHYGLRLNDIATLRLTRDPFGRGVLHLVVHTPRVSWLTPCGEVEVQADPLGGWILTLRDGHDLYEVQQHNRFSGVLWALEALGGVLDDGAQPEPPRAVG